MEKRNLSIQCFSRFNEEMIFEKRGKRKMNCKEEKKEKEEREKVEEKTLVEVRLK